MGLSVEQFETNLLASRLVTSAELAKFKESTEANSADEFAEELVQHGRLTAYQATRLLAGQAKGLVLGDYIIKQPLGAGGMGEVFRAYHKHLKRDVAVKLLPADQEDSAGTVERFQREMQALARLEHPNIVIAHDAGNVDGRPFLVMQYVEGEDLGSLVRRNGPMSVEEAVDCIRQSAEGLDYAHREGIIHRDLKPANLLRDKRGTIKVLDLGLARLVQSAEEDVTNEALTAAGQIMGTVDFMAPEQAEDTRQADQRSDIYSLGCTFFALLTGRSLFQAADSIVKKILAHREQPVEDLRELRPDVSPELDAVFRHMVAKRPEDRFATMRELIEALEHCPLTVPLPVGPAAAANDMTISASPNEIPLTTGPNEETEVIAQKTAAAIAAQKPANPSTDVRRKAALPSKAPRAGEYRIGAAPPRRRRRPWLRLFLLLLLVIAATVGVMLYDERWDYFGLRDRLTLLRQQTPHENGRESILSPKRTVSSGDMTLRSIAFSADGSALASAGSQLIWWDARTGKRQKSLEISGTVNQVTYSPNGHWLASAGARGFQVWDAVSGEPRSALTQKLADVATVAFSPDSQLLVTAGHGMAIWNVTTGKLSARLWGPTELVNQVAFSRKGNYLAAARPDGSVKVWDMTTGHLKANLGQHGGAVRVVLFSPGDRFLASADDSGSIKLWDVASWRPHRELPAHEGAVTSLVFLDEGRLVVSGGDDGKIRVSDAETAEEKLVIDHGEPISALAKARGDLMLASSSNDGSIAFWDVAIAESAN